ncbi:MAG: FecCD family ABC transporter permease [Nitrospinota bacterium]
MTTRSYGAWLCLAALAGVIVLGTATGPVPIAFGKTARILLWAIGLPVDAGASPEEAVIVLRLRLPRVLKAVLVGGGLAVCGVWMQAVFRNPLADPALLGVSAGGGLLAVLAIFLGLSFAGPWTTPIVAALGGWGASILVLAVGHVRREEHLLVLLLAGLAVNSLAGALISLILLHTSQVEGLRAILFWLAGNLEVRSWTEIYILAAFVLGGTAPTLLAGRAMNLLLLGEDEARSLGLPVRRFRVALLGMNGLVTGAAVAFSGIIGFVGLMAPHIVRRIVGPDHRRLLPASFLVGAILLVLADWISRTVVRPFDVRVGVIMALLGAPAFLILLLRHKEVRG